MNRWIAFDADDTLWENELYYQRAQQNLELLLADYCPPEVVHQTLLATETRNIPYFGYGIKSFGISMIETAIQLSDGRIPAAGVQSIVERLKEMVDTPVELLPDVLKTLETLSAAYRIMVITKGDLLDQERKLKNSPLTPFVEAFEVVNVKEMSTYQSIMNRWKIRPRQFVMVGNSLRSDVLPVAALGGIGVWVNHYLTWEHEKTVNADLGEHPYYEIESIKYLPGLLEKVQKSKK